MEEELRSIFRAAPIGIAILKDRINQRVNRAWCDIFGYTEAEIIGKTSRILYETEAEYKRVGQELYTNIGERGIASLYTRVRRKDGAIREISITAAPLLSEDASLRTVVTIEDITERKRAEEKERKRLEAENFRRGMDDSPLGVRIVTKDGDVVYANQAILDIYGYSSIEELKSTPVKDLYTPESFAEYEVRLEKMKHGEYYPPEYDLTIRKKNGELRHLHFFRKEIIWNGEKQLQVLCNDMTERRLAEMKLEERTRQLEEANKELESFSYSVSHDLRAPLRAIDGYARMILQKEGKYFDEETKRKFDVIRFNSKQMATLIDDLIALSRLSRKQMFMTTLNMEDIIRDVWSELNSVDSERKFSLNIHSMPLGYGDRTLIKQVYANLLGNAIKFTKNQDTACIEVGSRIENNESIYYVKDNGVGFDMTYYGKLFGIFQRLHSAEDFEGTGVGLAIIQRIIQRHGGRVWAEGKEAEGATFYFTLPSQTSNTI